MEGFYGVEVSAGQQVKPKIPEEHALRLTQIALPANASAAVSLIVSFQGKQFTIATLDPKKSFQMSTDLVFTEPLTLSATGAGCVHVTGYVQPVGNDLDSLGSHDFADDEEDDDDDEEELEAVPAKKMNGAVAPASDDDDDDEEDDEDDEEAMSGDDDDEEGDDEDDEE
ncbi:nucleolar RNA-binding protein, partial [Trypanosoma theileri]